MINVIGHSCSVTMSLTCQSNNNVLYVDHNAAQPDLSKCRKESKRPKWKTELASEFTEGSNDCDISIILWLNYIIILY